MNRISGVTATCFTVLFLHSPVSPSETGSTIDPRLSEEDDRYLNDQASALLEHMGLVLAEYPPQLPEPPLRRSALLVLDGVFHDEVAARRPAVQQFFHERMAAAVHDIETRQVLEGAVVWKLYNHSFVVRTASVTFAFDLVRADFVAEGFGLSDSLMNRIVNRCDALFISHRHRDHADGWVATEFLDQGKPVVAPLQVWDGDPIHRRITHLKREAHTLQHLAIQNGSGELQVVVYPGHQWPDSENNVSLVFTPEGMSFVQTGDQSFEGEDFAWIDSVGTHHQVDVMMPNCWTLDLSRMVRGFDAALVISGHENELGHSVVKRVPYWLAYKRRAGEVFGHFQWVERYDDSIGETPGKEYEPPLVLMTWGESFHYLPAR